MELLKAMVSRLNRMAVLWEPGVFGERTMGSMREETEVAARALGVQVEFIEARRPDDLERAFAAMREARIRSVVNTNALRALTPHAYAPVPRPARP